MDANLAYEEEYRTELLDGRIVSMSPRPSVNHNRVASNIFYAFRTFLKGKPCEAFGDGTDVYLTEKDRFVPDAMIVCNRDIIKWDGIHGAPDLIVEVLSPSTAKKDRGYKKDVYEHAGIREYWIVEPLARTVETYLLSDGKYTVGDVYALYPKHTVLKGDEEEVRKESVPVSLYDGFSVPLEEIFSDLFVTFHG